LKEGFLGSAAPLTADLVLLLEIAMGVGLIIGGQLARTRRFRLHALCQSVIVLLNLVVIALTMSSSFRVQVLPAIPSKLNRAYYGFGATHAALGSLTEGAALYILLAAGTNVLPEPLRISKYRIWMRSVLVLWWIVLLLGFATYTRWYLSHMFRK
jgi:uncharacterized membrane protein YozB (DUF420 family)